MDAEIKRKLMDGHRGRHDRMVDSYLRAGIIRESIARHSKSAEKKEFTRKKVVAKALCD